MSLFKLHINKGIDNKSYPKDQFFCFFLKNLLEKPEDREIVQDHALSMVQCKVLKQLELLEARKYDDPDIIEDLQYLNEKLQASVQDLRYKQSTFLAYYIACLIS